MAIIDLHKKRETSGAYFRLIGDESISNLMTAFHAGSIEVGNQVSKRLKLSYIGDLPIYSGEEVNSPTKTLKVLSQNPDGVIIFNGYVKNKNGKKQEVDLIIFYCNKVHTYEIKDGNSLDTKKSPAEIDAIENAMSFFQSKNYNVEGGLVLMHIENNKHSIKDPRAEKYVISGREICKKFNFDFSKFVYFQENETDINKQIVLDEMKRILENEGIL